MKLILIVGFIIILSDAFVFKRYEIFGNATEGCYTLPIYLGGESQSLQQQSMLIDTGSGQTTLTCSDCTVCQQRQLPFYRLSDSSSSHIVQCGQKLPICKDNCAKDKQYCYDYIHYLDGSESYGQIVEDKIRFSAQESDDQAYFINFLCNQIEYFSPSFKPNGVIGFAPNNMSNILDWWFYRNQKEAVLTICMAKNGGFVELGKNQEIQQHDLVLEFDNSTYNYQLIGLKAVSFGSIQLLKSKPDKFYSLLLDTGTTRSIIPQQALQLIIAQLISICHSKMTCIYLEDSNCVKFYKSKQLTLQGLDHIFPHIEFEIDSDFFKMMPSQYFIPSTQISLGNALCLTLQSIPRFDKIILGIDFMAENRFQFNLDKNTISVRHRESCIYEPLKQQASSSNEGFYQDYYIQIISIVLLIMTIALTIKPNIKRILRFFRSFSKSQPKKQLQQENTEDQHSQSIEAQANNQKIIIIKQSRQNAANAMVNSEIEPVLKDETA